MVLYMLVFLAPLFSLSSRFFQYLPRKKAVSPFELRSQWLFLLGGHFSPISLHSLLLAGPESLTISKSQSSLAIIPPYKRGLGRDGCCHPRWEDEFDK